MKALILAAGFGTRLKPFTNSAPKTLVPVNTTPLILYILAFLKKNGIKDVIINLHHHGQQIQKFLKNGSSIGMKIRYSHEPKILGTGGGIKKALRYVQDNVLIINGDVIADFNLKDLIKLHRQNKAYATFGLYRHPKAHKYGKLYYSKNRLLSILNHPPVPDTTSSAMFGSYHILSKQQALPHFKKFKAKEKFCIMRQIYIPQIEKGADFNASIMKGYWAVCDSLEDVKRSEKQLKKRKLSFQSQLDRMAQKLL